MGRLHNQIEEVKREIAAVDRDIGLLLGEYGLQVSRLRNPVTQGDAGRLYQELAKAIADHDNIHSRIAHLTSLENQMDSAVDRLTQVKANSKQTRAALDVIYGRIGAIAWEEAASHVCAVDIRSLLVDYDDHQAAVTQLEQERAALTRQTASLPFVQALASRIKLARIERALAKKTEQGRLLYIASGKAIAQAMQIKSLHSAAAGQLEAEYLSLSGEVAGLEEEIGLLSSKISKGRSELEQAGVAGPVERKIQELHEVFEQVNEHLKTASEAYGREVRRQNPDWEGLEGKHEVQKCENRMRSSERHRKVLEDRIVALQKEIEIDEQVLMIAQDEERIGHIRSTIEQFNRHIAEIEFSIREKRDRIAKLKASLDELNGKSPERER